MRKVLALVFVILGLMAIAAPQAGAMLQGGCPALTC
jgi:hypothetical protein